MTIQTLKSMFNPCSIAIIGRGHQEDDPAARLEHNLVDAGFQGPVLPINPNCHSVAGVLAYRDVASLPETPELAISTLPLAESPALIGELGARGTQAVLLLSDERLDGWQDHAALKQALLVAAKPHRLRILGPDRLGMAIPVNHINVTLSHTPLNPGAISVVAQSSTLLRAIINWAQPRQIGFSHLVSLGDRVDVGFSELLDYLAQEHQTGAILLYLESIRNPRQFMSAARVTARLKPVIALKPRFSGSRSIEESIYDAAARRVGILRVDTIEQLFNAAETLANCRPVRKNRLLILGNSHSMGLLAGDRLTREGGTLAPLSTATRDGLAGLVPPGYPVENPVDLGHRAGFKAYDRALERLLKEFEADGILIVHVPIAPNLDRDCGRAIVTRAAQSQYP
ncbi:MAG TPA: CoA-binding protein, partial [Candidatus Competibacteraceae bacterium]|nr:CoA-binding protein [Candidatus Competibacteraceae bacterium]